MINDKPRYEDPREIDLWRDNTKKVIDVSADSPIQTFKDVNVVFATIQEPKDWSREIDDLKKRISYLNDFAPKDYSKELDDINKRLCVIIEFIPLESNIVFNDNTSGNANINKHGYLPKLSGVSTEFLSGTGNFTTPAGGGGSSSGVELYSLNETYGTNNEIEQVRRTIQRRIRESEELENILVLTEEDPHQYYELDVGIYDVDLSAYAIIANGAYDSYKYDSNVIRIISEV